MGKSSEKSSTDVVAATPVSAPPSKSSKKSIKRDADVAIEKDSSSDDVRKDTDIVMKDVAVLPNSRVASPKISAIPQVQGANCKALLCGNLSLSIERSNLKEFFKDAGKVVLINFACDLGGWFEGSAHVVFASREEALKAFELDGRDLLGRPVRLDFAHGGGQYTPLLCLPSVSASRKRRVRTVIVIGLDISDSTDEVESILLEHFGVCGEIKNVIVTTNSCGAASGEAYIYFTHVGGCKKALALDGSTLYKGCCS